MRLDHIIVAVTDLDQAMADYRARGFTVFFGGQHAGGITHNALICLADGSYIELIAPVDPATSPHESPYLGAGQGFAGFALLSARLDDVATRLARAGLTYRGPMDGGRARTDGVQLAWQSLFLDGSISPFVIADVTPRVLRVPDDVEKLTHANGVTGIAALEVMSPDIGQTQAQYDTLFGQPSHSAPTGRQYDVGTMRLSLLPTTHAPTLHAPTPIRCVLQRSPQSRVAEGDAEQMNPLSIHGATFTWQTT